jgi:hypothetical protein
MTRGASAHLPFSDAPPAVAPGHRFLPAQRERRRPNAQALGPLIDEIA